MLAGCRERDEVRCHFGEETAIAETRGGGFHGVRHLGGALVWSAAEGLFVRPEGEPAQRLGPACTAGFDALRSEDALWVPCARRARPDAAKDGGLVLYGVGFGVTSTALPGTVGPEGAGVAAVLRDGDLEIAWRAGEPEAFHVWRSRVDLATAQASEPERVSNPDVMAGPPTFFAEEDRLSLVWSEHWARAGARHAIGGHVVVSVDGGPSRTLVEVEDPEPQPRIARDARGAVLLFRDQRDPLEYPSLFAQRLTSDLRPHRGLKLIGRADEGGPIRTTSCEFDGQETLAVVVGRSWGAEDALVAVHLLGDDLGERFHEMQVYEYGGQLVGGDGICVGGRVELLIAERSVPSGPPAHLFTIPTACGE